MEIIRWNQVYSQTGTLIPVFFFEPDLSFLSYIHENGYMNVPIAIQGTDGLYDGVWYGTVDSPTRLGSCPPDYNSTKPILTMFIDTPFTIYPPQNGIFEIVKL